MKILIIAASLIFSLTAFAQGSTEWPQIKTQIIDWDASLPKSQEGILNHLHVLAYEKFHMEEEGNSCGGEASHFTLTDYYTFSSVTGEITYKIRVKFLVTGSLNYCQGEVVSECEVPVTIYSDDRFSTGRWSCTVVGEI